MNNDLISLSVELAKAHLAQNRMSHHDVPGFVRDIHEVLSKLENAASVGPRETNRVSGTPVAAPGSFIPSTQDSGTNIAVDESAAAANGPLRVAPILDDDPTDIVFAGLDPWLAKRISPKMASKLDPRNTIHPTVFPDYIVCLEDGEKVKLLRPYVQKRFGLAFNEYLDKWNLPDDYPTAPPKYLEAKRAAAKASGLGVTTRANREKSHNARKAASKILRVKANSAGTVEAANRGRARRPDRKLV